MENRQPPTRFRTKKAKYNTDKLYAIYKKRIGKLAKSKTIYNKITCLLSAKLIHKIIVDEWIYKLPLMLGNIGVYHNQTLQQYVGRLDRLKVNHGASNKLSKELGKRTLVFFENENTDGKIYKVLWAKDLARFDNKRFYAFSATREKFGRMVAKHINAVKGQVTYLKRK